MFEPSTSRKRDWACSCNLLFRASTFADSWRVFDDIKGDPFFRGYGFVITRYTIKARPVRRCAGSFMPKGCDATIGLGSIGSIDFSVNKIISHLIFSFLG